MQAQQLNYNPMCPKSFFVKVQTSVELFSNENIDSYLNNHIDTFNFLSIFLRLSIENNIKSIALNYIMLSNISCVWQVRVDSAISVMRTY